MTDTDKPERFAFGANMTDTCPCPAVAAGLDPNTDHTEGVAAEYDEIVRNQMDTPYGTVDVETAREAWLEVVDRFRDRAEEAPSLYGGVADTAEEVARRLGWV